MVERRLLRNFDFTLMAVALVIVVYGCATIYSATRGGPAGLAIIKRQVVWAIAGLLGAVVTVSIDHSIYNRFGGKIYGITLAMLVAVLLLGDASKGAQRWIEIGPVRLQPSEFAKMTLIISLAVFLVSREREIRTFKTFALSFLYFVPPLLLIFKQPDLSTSLVLVAIWISMVYVMGTDARNIVICVIGIAVLGVAAWHTPNLIKDYQKKRISTFRNPSADPLGSGYHVAQSRIAIGSGQALGKGFMQGTQRKLLFIPEQHTDFIFTVVGEENGFVGGAGLLLLYLALLWRALSIMSSTEDSTGRAIAAGIIGAFSFHILINVGMTMGIMPVTGVPLPLFSYGGSSLMASLMGIGLLEGISMRRHRISF